MTIATSPGLINKFYKLAIHHSEELKWIGKFIGVATIVHGSLNAIDDFSNRRCLSGSVNLAKAVGQGLVTGLGGEEAELLWNTGVLARME